MAIVPLLVIRTMVMIAIRMSGMRALPTFNAKTSLGFGQGTVVDIRTFMYEVRKQVKMNVSLRRKIHIIALPQGTRNACLSADQSETTPGKPAGPAVDSPVAVKACSAATPASPSSAAADSPLVVRAFSDMILIRSLRLTTTRRTAPA